MSRTRRALIDATSLIWDSEHIANIIGGGAITTASIGVNFVLPYILGELSSQLEANVSSIRLFGIEMNPYSAIAIMGSSFILSYSLPTMRAWALSKLSPTVNKKLHARYVRHQLNESIYEHDRIAAGVHNNLLTKCYTATQALGNDFHNQVLPTSLEIVAATIAMSLQYGYDIGLTLGGSITAYAILNIATKNTIVKAREPYNANSDLSTTASTNALAQYESIHLNNAVEHAMQRVEDALQRYAESEYYYSYVSNVLTLGQNLIIGLGFTGLSMLATASVISGRLTTSDLVTIIAYGLGITSPMSTLATAFANMVTAHTDARAIIDVLNTDHITPDPFPNVALTLPKVDENANAVQAFPTQPIIQFINVSYTHKGNANPTLKNISFTIFEGQQCALVGPSGSGKSTILYLLFRFYQPTEGQILVYGQDISKVSLRSLRELIGYAAQQPKFDNRTIFDIVADGKGAEYKSVTATDASAALDEAHLLDDINNKEKFPDGLQTLVCEHGSRLSGGQKQRLALARALVKKPHILACDEATSALDSKTGHAIVARLAEARRTGLSVVHQFGGVTDAADKILVIENGVKVEEGTHETLLASKGVYAALWAQQNPVRLSVPPALPAAGSNADTKQIAKSESPRRTEANDNMRGAMVPYGQQQRLFPPAPATATSSTKVAVTVDTGQGHTHVSVRINDGTPTNSSHKSPGA